MPSLQSALVIRFPRTAVARPEPTRLSPIARQIRDGLDAGRKPTDVLADLPNEADRRLWEHRLWAGTVLGLVVLVSAAAPALAQQAPTPPGFHPPPPGGWRHPAAAGDLKPGYQVHVQADPKAYAILMRACGVASPPPWCAEFISLQQTHVAGFHDDTAKPAAPPVSVPTFKETAP
jgi:hypothetical protein